MPLQQLIRLNSDQAYGIWHIQETEEELAANLQPALAAGAAYSSFKHPQKRLEWLATRVAYQQVCQALQTPCMGILKTPNGRPYLANNYGYVSLSHCFPFAAVMVSMSTPVGIDIQIAYPKLAVVQAKYLSYSERIVSNQDLEKLGIYWAAKEAIYKNHVISPLSLSQIRITTFAKAASGIVQGYVPSQHNYTVHYQATPAYILAWSRPTVTNSPYI
jgi:4'-phosphopantetheinyl transferase